MNDANPDRPSISINTLCLPEALLDVHVATVKRLGVAAISPTLEHVLDYSVINTAQLVGDAGLTIATLTHRAFGCDTPDVAAAACDRLNRTIDVAAEIGAGTITLTTGGRGPLTWTDAAARFADAITPYADIARKANVKLSLEPTSHLYADASIAHRLSDTVVLARAAGIHVGIDIFACWFDADIEEAIKAAGPHIALVQISDYVYGDRGLPCRAVPGDGCIPLASLISQIHVSGFRGFYDIELFGPRIDAEGAESALARTVKALENMIPAD